MGLFNTHMGLLHDSDGIPKKTNVDGSNSLDLNIRTKRTSSKKLEAIRRKHLTGKKKLLMLRITWEELEVFNIIHDVTQRGNHSKLLHMFVK